MSSEIAQAPKEDIPLSSAIADDLDLPPNTHLELPNPDAYGMFPCPPDLDLQLLFAATSVCA